MHPKTRSHYGYLQATESRETIQKLSIGPKEVDWASSLRKNKMQLRKHKVVHFMHPQNPISQRVPHSNGIERNHQET